MFHVHVPGATGQGNMSYTTMKVHWRLEVPYNHLEISAGKEVQAPWRGGGTAIWGPYVPLWTA